VISVIVQSDSKLANPAGAKLNAQAVAGLAWKPLDGAKAGAVLSGCLGYSDCIGALVSLRYYGQVRKRLEASPFMQDPFRELAVRIQLRKIAVNRQFIARQHAGYAQKAQPEPKTESCSHLCPFVLLSY